MSGQFAFLVKIALVTFSITVLWAASVAFTYWDTHRQRQASKDSTLWMVIVTILPFIGFTAYILFRSMSMALSSKIKGEEPKTRRVTFLKPPQARRRPLSTITASDLDIQAVRESKQTIQASEVGPVFIPKYSIIIDSGSNVVKEFILERLPARIGRGSEAAIRLDGDLGVSRRHAEIYEQGGSLRIRDLQSTHGTQVNGIRIGDRNLDIGDRIQVGSSVLQIKRIKE